MAQRSPSETEARTDSHRREHDGTAGHLLALGGMVLLVVLTAASVTMLSGAVAADHVGTDRLDPVDAETSQELSVSTAQPGGFESGDEVQSQLSPGPAFDGSPDQRSPRVTQQQPSGSVDLQDEIQEGDSSFNVTITELDNVGNSAWLEIDNTDNDAFAAEFEVIDIQTITLTPDDIGGIQAGDTIQARLANDSDYVNVLDTDSTTVSAQAEPDIQIQGIKHPDTIQPNDNLPVDYTLVNQGDADGTESFVDLLVQGTNSDFDDTDENVTVPAGQTTSGTLTFTNVSRNYNVGDTIAFSVELWDFNDTAAGTTSVQDSSQPNLQLESIAAPDEITPDQNLAVDYTIQNVGDADGTESFVDLLVQGTNSDFDDTDENVTVPAGEATSRTLVFDNVSGFFDPGDTISYTVQLFDSGDSLDGTTTVVEGSNPSGSVDLQDEIRPGDSSFDVTITALDNAGGTGYLRVENLDNDAFAANFEVEEGEVLTLAPDDIGGFQAGDTIQARLAADSDFVNILDTDSTTVTEQTQSEFVVESLDTNAPVVEGEALAVDAEIVNTGGAGEQQVDLSVVGIGADTTTVSLDSGESTTASFTLETEEGDAGEYDATVASEDDQTSTAVTVTEAGGFAVTIVETNSPVVEGESLAVDVEVTNTGSNDTQTVTLDAGSLGSTERSVTLDSNESEVQSFTLQTGPGDAGEYNATVASEDDQNSTEVAVTEASEFAVTIVGTNSPVGQGGVLEVDAEITNTGTGEGTQTVTLDVEALGGGSTTVSLAGNESTTETFTLETDSGDAGEYTATVASEDTQDIISVLVQDGGGDGSGAFEVAITETNAPVEEGETLEVAVTVTNTGEMADTQTVTAEVGEIGTVETTVSLAGGESTTESFTLETDSGDAGEYATSVATEDDQASASLSVESSTAQPENATFAVTIESVSTPPDGEGEFRANVTVENADDFEDSQTVTLSSNGTQRGSQAVTLTGGTSELVSFSWEQDVAADGEATVEVEAASESDSDVSELTVSTGDGGGGVSTTTWLLLILLVLALLAIYYYIRRRQLREQAGRAGGPDDTTGDGSGDGGGSDSGGGGDRDSGN